MCNRSLRRAVFIALANAGAVRDSVTFSIARVRAKHQPLQLSSQFSNRNRVDRRRNLRFGPLTKAVVLGTGLALSCWSGAKALDPSFWSGAEITTIKLLSIAYLRPLKPDGSNRVSDDPQAAELGKALFFDTRFSANGAVSCASCHMPERQFQDDLRVGHGIADVARRTMPLAGAAYQTFFFWDGRKDSQWSQALGPLENPAEHGADRTMAAQLIATHYQSQYEGVFGSLPNLDNLPPHAAPTGASEAVVAWQALSPDQQYAVNLTFANMGKAIAAFERTIPVPTTRFDAYAAAVIAKDIVAADKIFTEAERNGLKLFLNEGDCVRCHNGPQFSDMRFYNLGLPDTSLVTDSGRSTAVYALKEDPFNCLGKFSDATKPSTCLLLKLLQFDMPEQVGAFKSPSLRGVAQRPPYMHTGQFTTLHDVLVHYNNAPKAPFGVSELSHPRKLTDIQLNELEAFLRTLNVNETPAE